MFKPRGKRATGSSAIGQPDADVGETPREPPRPRPLLGPALALILGIWLSDLAGPVSGITRALVPVAPLVALGVLAVLWRRRGSGRVLLIGAAGVALTVGFARHQSVIHRPAHHLAHALGTEPVLTRLAGRIIKPPTTRPSVKYNAFLPFDPPAKTSFVLAADELRTTDPPTPITGHVRVAVEATGLDLRVGQRVQLTGKLYRPSGPRNPGARDWARWYQHQGIDAGLAVENAAHVKVLSDNATRWQRLTGWVRGKAQSLLFEPYADLDADESVRLLDVMVLGQRSTADPRLNEAFRNAGGMHFLAVSGFHVGVLAGAVWWLFRRGLGRSRNAAALALVSVAILYAIVAEPNAPVLRAVVVVTIAGLAMMGRRPICIVNSLALAALVILMHCPQQLFRASFQFSFVLTVGLVVAVPSAHRMLFARRTKDESRPEAHTGMQLFFRKIPSVLLRKVTRGVVDLALLCTVAWAITVPLKLHSFGYLAPWGWLGTFLLSPLIMFTILLSFSTLVANALVPPVGALLGMGLRWTTEGLLHVVELLADLPGMMVPCQRPPGWLTCLTYVGLWIVVTRWHTGSGSTRRGKHSQRPVIRASTLIKSTLLALLALAWTLWLVLPADNRGPDFAVHVLAVGTGTAALLTAPGGHTAMYDVGTITNSDAGQTAAEALQALGRRDVEAVLISHANFDHYSGLPTLMERCHVASWLTNLYFIDRGAREGPVDDLLALLPPETPAPQTLRAGDRLALGAAFLDVLWPPDGLANDLATNDRSLVIKFSAAGRTVLLPGDVGSDALHALLEDHHASRISLHADVLVAPHHGSVRKDVTAAFYAAVAPSCVIVSSHTPRPRLRALVRDVLGPDCPVLLTGDVGAVTVRISPDGDLTIDTPYASDETPAP